MNQIDYCYKCRTNKQEKMDSNITVKSLPLLGVCNLCLGDGAFRSMLTHQPSAKTEESYSDMLLKCFGIDVLGMGFGDTKQVVCEMCIQKLRDSMAFKAMAQTSLRTLEVAAQKVKKEEIPIEFDDNSLDDDDDFVWEDNEGKHTKICEKEPMDWTKIVEIERRDISTSNSILRENSLKLLANSTICVFQWNKSRYRCFCCQEPFTDMSSLREHTNSVHSLKNIEKIIILQQNKLVKVEISSLFCKLCSKPLDNLNNLKTHLTDIHDVEFGMTSDNLLVPFKLDGDNLQCQLCFETFRLFRLLNIHMNKHYQKEVCHICGAGFSNLLFLKLHKSRTHRRHYCKECAIEFSNRSEKKDHDVAMHDLKVERKLRFPCPYCDERFLHEKFKVSHLVDKHGMAKPEHKCPSCEKVYVTRSLRNTHIKNVHMKEKNHECNVCDMRFYTKNNLTRHSVTHTGEKNYSCTTCNNLYATKKSLQRHLKTNHIN